MRARPCLLPSPFPATRGPSRCQTPQAHSLSTTENNTSPPHLRGNPPAQHPPYQGENSTDTQRNSEIGFWVFIQNNTGGGCHLASLRRDHRGQHGPAPSATRREGHSHHRNCTVTGSVVVTEAGPDRGLPGGGDPCPLPRPQRSPALPGTLTVTQRQEELNSGF